ncbi:MULTISPECIES: hypothetical protein [unclassified Microcoleus]|uniref:hypothetical protein n=1 Tax=unclassified Microcoleus TaxID=2642155 RepID=UPI002FD70560
MASRELHLELLLGKCVFDSTGNRVGRIEEVRAQQQGDDWVIVEYLVGIPAIVERLSAWNLGAGLLHLLGARNLHKGYRIPWDQLDLFDPEHPRLICTIDALKEISQQLERDAN